MKTLPAQYRKHGCTFTLLKRNGHAAIYEGSAPKGGFEVIRIQASPAARVPGGRELPDREAVPPTSSWGAKGWSFLASDREGALKRYRSLRAPQK